jgi:transposase-like protein
VAVAVETKEGKVGRIRLGVIPDASGESLEEFVKNSVEKGSTIVTDGWSGYNGIKGLRYKHMISDKFDENKMLPSVHLVISLLRRWIMGTLQGSLSSQHMAYYLDEFTFRFNRRTSASRGMLFYRLLEQAVEIEPVIYDDIRERKGA